MNSNKTREWLLYNAVLTWLHHYADMETELTPQYKQLEKELQFEYEGSLNEQPTTTETQERGSEKKGQRTKKTTSNPSSTEENKTTNQET
tara:strand:+ start:224 stop:493 length:270 start_codon:yes stop_codon:yes gene_type:complete